ncbi:MAG: TAXI family TRAP transporter solute-binding subunit [Pseudomonadota bacterium]
MRIVLGLLVFGLAVGLLAWAGNGLKPPETVRFATGIDGGGYWQIGQRYRFALARDDIDVTLVETAGSIENIEKLIAGDVDVALVQGGIAIAEENGLQSLGAIFLEPISIFHSRQVSFAANPGEWNDVKLAAGPEGSGTRAAARALIKAAELSGAGIELLPIGGMDALAALRTGEANAVMFVSPLGTSYLTEAIQNPEFLHVPLSLVEALALKLPGARATAIPAGALTIFPPQPAEEIKFLSLRASLVAREGLHPAVVDRFVQAAIRLHSDRDVLHGFREYPSAESPPVPLNEAARQLILSGPNMLHGLFPYWIAAQFGRVLLLILPLLFILPPIMRALPAVYVWFQKRRIWRHYQRISAFETELAEASSQEEITQISEKIDQLDKSLAELKLPLAYRQGAYEARVHIGLIRQEIARRTS